MRTSICAKKDGARSTLSLDAFDAKNVDFAIDATVALILALSRKILQAHDQIHDGNFTLTPLRGFDL